jgi:hypothetical protein
MSLDATLKLLESLDDMHLSLAEAANEIVTEYPSSKTLVELANELSQAIKAMDGLSNRMIEALKTAEMEDTMKVELMGQLGKSELYGELSDKEKEDLAEYLVQAKKGLADEPALIEFVQESFNAQDNAKLLTQISKKSIIRKGSEVDPSGDAFEQYNAGLADLRGQLENPLRRGEIVAELSKSWFRTQKIPTIKKFYHGAFEGEFA